MVVVVVERSMTPCSLSYVVNHTKCDNLEALSAALETPILDCAEEAFIRHSFQL